MKHPKVHAHTLMVLPVDREKLAAWIRTLILPKEVKLGDPYENILKNGTPNPEEQIKYSVDSIAVVVDCNMATNCDCVHWVIEKKLLETMPQPDYVIDVPVWITTKTPEGWGHSMFPSFEYSLPLDKLIADFTLPPVTLVEFMGSRFNYNPRINQNTGLLIKTINDGQ